MKRLPTLFGKAALFLTVNHHVDSDFRIFQLHAPFGVYSIEVVGIDVSFMEISCIFDLVYPLTTQIKKAEVLLASDYLLCDESRVPLLIDPGFGSISKVQGEDGCEAIRYEYDIILLKETPPQIRFVSTLYQNDEWVTMKNAPLLFPL